MKITNALILINFQFVRSFLTRSSVSKGLAVTAHGFIRSRPFSPSTNDRSSRSEQARIPPLRIAEFEQFVDKDGNLVARSTMILEPLNKDDSDKREKEYEHELFVREGNETYSTVTESNIQGDKIIDIGGKVVVSGFAGPITGNDQFIFDVLHDQGIWENIVALSPDSGAAKKRLISRSARYTGLLDHLSFAEADIDDSEQLKANLEDTTSWIHFLNDITKLKDRVEVAKDAGVKNIVIALKATDEEMEESGLDHEDISSYFEGTDMRYTVFRVGDLTDGEEGMAVSYNNFTAKVGTNCSIPKMDVFRFAAEAVLLPQAHARLITVSVPTADSTEFFKAVRSGGRTRRQEIGDFFRDGITTLRLEKQRKAEREARDEAEAKAYREREEKKREAERLEWSRKFAKELEEESAEKAKEKMTPEQLARQKEIEFRHMLENEGFLFVDEDADAEPEYEYVEEEVLVEYITFNATGVMDLESSDFDGEAKNQLIYTQSIDELPSIPDEIIVDEVIKPI